MLAEAGMEVEKSTGERETNSDLQIDVNGAQDIAEIIKKHFPEKVIILENFHYLEEKEQRLFAFDLRTFQDINVRVVILGIWRERNRLTQYNGDLQNRIIELPVEPWTEEHLQKIIKLGEESLNIDMSEIKNDLIEESFGNVGMLQELCKECCYDAHIIETGDPRKVTKDNLQNAVTKITNSYASRFHRALETFADAKPRHGLKISPFNLSINFSLDGTSSKRCRIPKPIIDMLGDPNTLKFVVRGNTITVTSD